MTTRVALVANTSWYVFNFRAALIRSLLSKGYEVVVLAPYDQYAEEFPKWGVKYCPTKMYNKGTNPLQDLALTYKFYQCFRRERPDVLLTYTIKPNIYASVAAGALNIPVINNVSGLGTLFIDSSPVTRLVQRMYKFAMRRSAKIFFQNNDDLAVFLDAGLAHPSVIERIPGSGVDTRKFGLAEARRNDDRFTFLLPARLLWQKGVGEFVKAARVIKARYSGARFQLLGFLDVDNRSAVSRAQMEEWLQEGVVEYLGVTDNVVEPLRAADCVVLPSYREGVPRSLLEAASVGKPIITTRSVGCREVVDDGVNGFLCAPRDADDLAEKMEWMMNLSQHERTAMGLRGRDKMIREFDERFVIDRYLTAIREALVPQELAGVKPA